MSRLVFTCLLLLSWVSLAQASPDLPKLVQLIDYVGVDYRGAVSDGEIVNPAEYTEMQDFSAAIVEQTQQLPASDVSNAIASLAQQLQQLVEQRQAADQVASLAAQLRRDLIAGYNVQVMPRAAPDLARAQQLYADNCAACHGLEGHGDGPAARGMEPAPTDFRDSERYQQRTLYGLYSTISAGVEDTAMRGFQQSLSEDDRWSLAFLVGAWAADPAAARAGKTIWSSKSEANALSQLNLFTITTPAEAEQSYGPAGRELMAFLRTQPKVMFANASPLDYAHDMLNASVEAYRDGDQETAYKLAVAAYLEGFELVEHGLNTVDSALRLQIETEMTRFRNLTRGDNAVATVEAQAETLQELLNTAGTRLGEATLSNGAAFLSAFIILLREGLEAILVVAALAAFLIKTERRDALPYLHSGWISALALGGLTWLGATYLFDFSGANREITEGVAALVAMAVLFYVGFWMHSKTNALQWKRFIDGSVQKALSTGTLWGLTLLSFIAVYREVFETILFYQALWVQAQGPAQGMLISGMGVGALVLAVLAWFILRYSTRLPLRQFFSATSVFMFVLAIIFAGKGIAALQEAGKLPIDPVDFPRVDILGIYPNLQGLLLQGGLLLLAALILWGGLLRRRAVNA